MPRRLPFRYRIGLLVLPAAAGLIAVTAVELVLARKSEREMTGVETRYVPLIELDRDLKFSYSQLRQALEDAAEAADETRLAAADALDAELAKRLRAGAGVIADNGGDAAALERELAAYYTSARAVTAAIVGGTPPAQLATQADAMTRAGRAFYDHLDKASSPDHQRLADAFASARSSLDASLLTDVVIAIGVLAVMGALSYWIIRRTVRSLHEVSLGVERLAGGDFDREIPVLDGAELGDLARQANQTAARLREYRERTERDDWIKSGVAELSEAIAGELDAATLADRARAYLARYTGAARATVALGDGPAEVQTNGPELIVPFVHDDETLGVMTLGFADAPAERAVTLAGRVTGVVGTALRVAEAHRRVQALLDETRLAKDAADLANRELEAFSYSVSHDLRSPLRAIDGFSQALLTRHATALDAKGSDYLNRVRAAAQRMGELIDALLQLSQINRTQIARQRCDLSEAARALADELARRDPDRAVTFAIPDGIVAQADGRMVRALLDNLLGNAWKFTAKTAGARIELCADVESGETIYRVRDNGAGFDMAYAAKLFAPFQRLHSEAEFKGTGIGLATVRRIVDRHGGRVWAEGAVGRGATVSFTLAPAAVRGGPA